MSIIFAEQSTAPKRLIMDIDSKFTAAFRETLETDNVELSALNARA